MFLLVPSAQISEDNRRQSSEMRQRTASDRTNIRDEDHRSELSEDTRRAQETLREAKGAR